MENRIAQRSKNAYNIATKIVETKTTERNFTYEEVYKDGVSDGIREIKDEIRKLESNGIESDEVVNRIKAYNS